MSEEAPIDASASAGVASIEGIVLEKEEISTAANVCMESFFDGADVIAEAMASATIATTKEIPVKALVPLSRLVSAEQSTRCRGSHWGIHPCFCLAFHSLKGRCSSCDDPNRESFSYYPSTGYFC